MASHLPRQAFAIASSLLAIWSAQASHAECLPSWAVPAKVRDARVVVLGETHGTAEAPTFAGDLLCTLAHEGGRVVLALEIPSNQQPEIDAYVDGGTKIDFVRFAMADRHFWSRSIQDGRSSKAMIGLLERVRALRAQGLSVTVLAFDAAPSQLRPDVLHDEIMAENLRTSMAAAPQARLLVLVGSVHAAKSVNTSFGPNFQPAIKLLREDQLVSFRMTHSGGEAWVCLGHTMSDPNCGVKTVVAASANKRRHRRITLDSQQLPDFDGYFDVGHITASSPAVGDHAN